jgi:hypothetical protein
MAQATPAAETSPEAAAPVPTTTTIVTTTVAEPAVQPTEIMLSGLDPEVSRALAEAGYTERVTPSEISGQLDPVVAQALADADTVLLVPETGGG